MKSKIISVALLTVMFIQGCTYKINSVKYNANLNLKKNDLFYHLPKTILIFSVNYKIVEKTKVVNGISSDPTTEYFVKSADVKTSTVNDPNQLYVARGKNISHSFFLKENIDFKFNDKGVIQSVETTFEDKSLESTESLLKGVAAIVETIALAGQGTDAYLQDISKKITKAYNDLAKAISDNNEKDVAKFKAQLKNYFELLSNYNDNNKEITKESEKTYTFIIDPDQLTVANGKKEFKVQPTTSMPEVKLVIDLGTVTDNKSKVLATGKTKDNNVLIPGLVYNIPSSLKTSVFVSTAAAAGQSIFESNIDYAQYGNFGFVPVASKIFTSRKTNLEFNPTTGALTTYKTESGSSSENLGKTIESSANLLKTTLTEVKYDNKIDILKKQKELKDLQDALKDKPQSQVDSLKNSLDLLKIQLDIKKIQQEIDNLQKKKE